MVNCGSSVGDAVDRRDRVIPRARTLDDLQERLSPRSLIGEASRAERKAGELLKEMEKAKGGGAALARPTSARVRSMSRSIASGKSESFIAFSPSPTVNLGVANEWSVSAPTAWPKSSSAPATS